MHILRELKRAGLLSIPVHSIRRAVLNDPDGDALDSVIAALATFRATLRYWIGKYQPLRLNKAYCTKASQLASKPSCVGYRATFRSSPVKAATPKGTRIQPAS